MSYAQLLNILKLSPFLATLAYFNLGDFANFSLNENSGWITIKSALDRDDEAVTQKGGVYAMYVQVSVTGVWNYMKIW